MCFGAARPAVAPYRFDCPTGSELVDLPLLLTYFFRGDDEQTD
jgi:hypothetical protein